MEVPTYPKKSLQKPSSLDLAFVGVNFESLSETISTGTPFPSDPNTTWFRKSSAVILASAFFHVGIARSFFEKRSTITQEDVRILSGDNFPKLVLCSDSMHSKNKIVQKYPIINDTLLENLYGFNLRNQDQDYWALRLLNPSYKVILFLKYNIDHTSGAGGNTEEQS